MGSSRTPNSPASRASSSWKGWRDGGQISSGSSEPTHGTEEAAAYVERRRAETRAGGAHLGLHLAEQITAAFGLADAAGDQDDRPRLAALVGSGHPGGIGLS